MIGNLLLQKKHLHKYGSWDLMKEKKEFRNMHCFPTPKCYNLSSQGNWFCWNYIRYRTKQIVKKLNPFWLTIYGHLIFDFIASCLYMWPNCNWEGKKLMTYPPIFLEIQMTWHILHFEIYHWNFFVNWCFIRLHLPYMEFVVHAVACWTEK